MVRKKVDSRVKTLVTNGVAQRHRSFFVIVGDKGRDQVVNLHYILSKATVKTRPSVLWCYKKDLGFSSHRKKRMRQVKKMIERGLLDPNTDDPFELFISSTNIRYTYYKDTQQILGNTYGMCVLQDFEAITPNTLARTIETVEGGGIVVLLLKTMTSLKQLYTLNMDIHTRYRTEAHRVVGHRFNERFLLSLATCPTCVVVDDELNVLPLSSHIREIAPVPPPAEGDEATGPAAELANVKDSLAEQMPIGALVGLARTLDQARAILMFMESAQEKTLRATVALTAARGRGKSAALGIAIGGAVGYGYANIYVTSPSPENLNTLFEFVFKTFDELGYDEHTHYEIVRSTNPDFNKAVVRVNIFRDHRQTIQYIQPHDAAKLGQAELVVIDEAAAIPLPYVKSLLGPYLVFMASTVNGYEGTGRSLSLKLIKQLREQANTTTSSSGVTTSGFGRELKEITLEEPIRYAAGDPVEGWLHRLLCLDVGTVPRTGSCPAPDLCSLYHVSRDTLFSHHKASEAFLQRMMSLYVSSHYRNTPNDLQMLADAPAHNLFVLLGPVDPSTGTLPEVLVVIQVCLEGSISRESVMAALGRGARGAGDLIPWTLSQQFQDSDFASLSGARIVRIATHPDYERMGYASRAMSLLTDYYEGKIVLDPAAAAVNRELHESAAEVGADDEVDGVPLVEQAIGPRRKLPPLLSALNERAPERLHYVGVSFGLTQSLFNFWTKAGMVPVYIRQTENSLTGEHTCIMVRELESSDLVVSAAANWASAYYDDFRNRFVHLLHYNFRSFTPSMALSILSPPRSGALDFESQFAANPVDAGSLGFALTPFDMKRLASYVANQLDYHVVMDLVPILAALYFKRRVPVAMPAAQAAVFLAVGLQFRTVTEVSDLLKASSTQVLALFKKAVAKIYNYFNSLEVAQAEASMPRAGAAAALAADAKFDPVATSMNDELQSGADAAMAELGLSSGKSKKDKKSEKAKGKKKKDKGKGASDESGDGDDDDGGAAAADRESGIHPGLTPYKVGGESADWSKVRTPAAGGIVSVRRSAKDTNKKRRRAIEGEADSGDGAGGAVGATGGGGGGGGEPSAKKARRGNGKSGGKKSKKSKKGGQ